MAVAGLYKPSALRTFSLTNYHPAHSSTQNLLYDVLFPAIALLHMQQDPLSMLAFFLDCYSCSDHSSSYPVSVPVPAGAIATSRLHSSAALYPCSAAAFASYTLYLSL
jgi:hypothetical protein